MTIIFYILCIAVGIFITYILGVQFYKLGQNLKERFPIIYRIYTIFWIFFGGLLLIGILIGIKTEIDEYQHKKKIEKIESVFEKYADDVDYRGLINEAKNNNASEKQIYQEIEQSKKFKNAFYELKKDGLTDYEIGNFLNLDPDNDYVSEAQIAANEAQAAAEQAQSISDDVVNYQNIQSAQPQLVEQAKKTYRSFDIFIAPELQEKVGIDIYQLKDMIAEAKNAQKNDKQILSMLRDTIQYGNIIKEYEKNGLSEVEIAEKFGLKI